MTFIEDIKKKITEKRNIRPSSLNAYVSNISKLHKLMFNKDIVNLDFLKNKKKVLDTIDNKKESTIKAYLAAIVVVLMAFNNIKKSNEKV